MITRRKPLRRSWIKRKPKKVRAFKKPMQLEREAAERKADREFAKAREICRYVTYRRAEGRCQRCGRPLILIPSKAQHAFEIANVHEHPSRAKGGDPTDSTITVCLCTFCHAMITDNKIMPVWKDPEKKAIGGVTFAPFTRES